MRNPSIVIFYATLLCLSCTKDRVSSFRTVGMSLALEEMTKVTLTGTDSPLKSGRIWKWEDGDQLTYTYLDNGKEYEMKPSTAVPDAKNPSLLHVTLKGVPENAAFTKVVYGSEEAFGKTCIYEGNIPSSLVYAESLIIAEPGETNLPGVTLDQQCSYFLIFPDYVTLGSGSYQIKDIEVSGHALKGVDRDETLSLTLFDPSTRTFKPVCLALSCNASGIVFTADYGAGKAVMATIASAGGKCTLFEISNKSIGKTYN